MTPLFLFEYIIYLFFFLDAKLEKPFLSITHSIIFDGYAFVLGAELLYLYSKKRRTNKYTIISPSMKIMVVLLVYYILVSLGEYTSLPESAGVITFLLILYFNGLVIQKFNCEYNYIRATYFFTIMFMLLLIMHGNINIVTEIRNVDPKYFFYSDLSLRVRNSLGFYNVNALGAIVECLLTLSAFDLINDRLNYKKMIRTLYIVCDIFLICLLYISGTRTAVALLAFFISVVLLELYNYKSKEGAVSYLNARVLKVAIAFFLILFILFGAQVVFQYYLDSGRGYAFDNFKLINRIPYNLVGLGMFPPGSIRSMMVNGIHGTILDNYYVYIILTSGIIGFIVVLSALIYIFAKLMKYKSDSRYGAILFSCYLCHLIYGLTEVCVIYYMFESSLIYFILIFGYLGPRSSNLQNT